DAAARGALEHAELEQVGLVDVLDGLRLLTDGDGQGGQPDGATVEPLADRRQDGPVDLVEAGLVDAEQCEPAAGAVEVDGAVAPHLGEVTHPLQQPDGDAGRAPGPPADLAGGIVVGGDAEDAGHPLDDLDEVVDG